MKPVIYCIEEYEYFNPYGNNAENLDQIYFLIILSCREGTVQLENRLSEFVEACKKHEPRLYRNLQNLLADMEEFLRSDTRLIRGLEKDGFDISRLLYVFFDNYDMEHIANWIKAHGKNQERRTVQEIQKSMTEESGMLNWGEFFGKSKEVTRKVYEAMKEVALGYLPTLNLLETDLMRSFNSQLNAYAMMMVDTAMSKWQQMEEQYYRGYDEEDEDEEDYEEDYEEVENDERLFSLEGLRQFYFNSRKDYPVEGCKDSPIFCVEIVEFVEEWETKGWNGVMVWYKLTCAEGEWYNDIELEYLIEEAMLYFPDIYADAVKYYEASSSPRPKDPAMLRGLQRKGHDLTPVLASYVANMVNFMPLLRETMRRKRLFADYQNAYEDRKEEEAEEDIDLEYVEKSQTISFLRNDLVSVAMAVILRELPEFHIRVPKSFLYYMECWAYHDYDPLNQLHEELESAFELKRRYKRED